MKLVRTVALEPPKQSKPPDSICINFLSLGLLFGTLCCCSWQAVATDIALRRYAALTFRPPLLRCSAIRVARRPPAPPYLPIIDT